MKGRTFALTIVVLAGCFAALGWAVSHWNANYEISSTTNVEQGPGITSDFELVDQTGRPARDEDFAGKWQLVFFGFTSCPDICPTTLGTVTAALEELGPVADKLQPLLISVDPERDTPPVMKEYLTPFDPRILGLTGTPDQIQAAIRSFRVYVSKRPLEGGDYTMDHSAFIYLMDPKGQYAAHFSSQTSMPEMTGEIRRILGDGNAS